MKPRYVEIFFNDEAPRIGAGRRVVKLEVGRKWAYCTAPSTGVRQRIAVGTLARLRVTDVKVRRKFRKPPKRPADEQRAI